MLCRVCTVSGGSRTVGRDHALGASAQAVSGVCVRQLCVSMGPQETERKHSVLTHMMHVAHMMGAQVGHQSPHTKQPGHMPLFLISVP